MPEYLKYKNGVGIDLKTADLTIKNGAASFSGSISAADGKFNVSRNSKIPITTPNGTKDCIASISTNEYGVAGIAVYSDRSYGGFFESRTGDGVRGISDSNDGGKFTTESTYSAGVNAENNDGGIGVYIKSSAVYRPQLVISPASLSSKLPPVMPGGITCDNKHWYGAVQGNNGAWMWRRFTTGPSGTFHAGGSARRTTD